MKKILVPIDFSTYSDNALDLALGLAKAGNSKIILLNVFHVPLTAWDTITSPDISVGGEFVAEQTLLLEKQSETSMEARLSKVQEQGISCEKIVTTGLVTEVILETIERRHIDMVIMGTKGAGWLKEVLIGSNAAKVIRKAKCPVIAVPVNAKFKGIKEIVYATDYQSSDIDSIKQLVVIAKLFDAELLLLHVADEFYPREESEGILKMFSEKVEKKVGYDKFAYKLLIGDAEDKLEEYVKRKRADLFAMSTQSRSLLERLFESSFAKTMAHHSRMPLMVFHHSDDKTIFN